MKKYLPYIIIVLVLAGLGVFAYRAYTTNNSNPVKSGEAGQPLAESNGVNQPKSTEPLSYTHPDLGFTVSYPGNYNISNMADDQGETVLFQDNGKGLQIYISDYTAKEDFNSALVRQSLSGEKLENLKDIAMPSGFNAVSFSGKDVSLGEVWDVWFVQNGKLYQITSQAGQEKLLKSLVESFKFE